MSPPEARRFEIEEADRRRARFSPDVAVTLADHQRWLLPRPRLGGGVAEFGPEFWGALDRFLETHIDPFPDEPIITPLDHDDPDVNDRRARRNEQDAAEHLEQVTARFAAELDLAVALLQVQYDLGVEEAEALAGFDFGSGATEADLARMGGLLDLAAGENPAVSFPDYMRSMMVANGILRPEGGGMLLEDARAALLVLSKAKRVLPADERVGWMIRRAERKALDQMLSGLI